MLKVLTLAIFLNFKFLFNFEKKIKQTSYDSLKGSKLC